MVEIYHVYPLDDLKEHEETRDCWCCPGVEEYDDRILIVHNSLDRWEEYEDAVH